MNILGIIQARFSSTRLPGKVLKNILGEPMLKLQIERIKGSKKIDKLIVATSENESDDAIEKLCHEISTDCFRGSLEDVLDRFYKAALPNKPSHVVRLTGDCPLTDCRIIDTVITKHLDEGNDYTSNIFPPTFPDGLDVEVMKFFALKRSWEEAQLKYEREHVTQYILKRPAIFNIGNLQNAKDLSTLRWTVDEPKDYQFAKTVFENLYSLNPYFGMKEILEFLKDNPGCSAINSAFSRNEGLKKSMDKEKDNLL